MDAWPSPPVPSLPGSGPQLRIFDTASGTIRPSEPGPTARMYVCGITPYDAAHVGHAATNVAFDLIGRVWRDAGHDVQYVQNVTDVDDPLLERARRDGIHWRELADRETALFRDDMTALRVLPPTHFVGAVEAIPVIAAAIRSLGEKGAAYDVEGDTYFPVHADPHFGSVSSLDERTMYALFAEMGGDPDRAGKKHPLDPLLWRSRRADEPFWETELGPGRPGWHIECTAIALDHLGDGIDIQGGGRDLVFPHHEMGASHAQVLTGRWPFAHSYVHAGMVGLDGEKMSKSKGNLVFVSSLRRDGHDPMAIRVALLSHHYRRDWEWTNADLSTGQQRLDKWREAVQLRRGPAALDTVDAVRRALADDLDAPTAMQAIDHWVVEALAGNGTDDAAPALVAATADALLGIDL